MSRMSVSFFLVGYCIFEVLGDSRRVFLSLGLWVGWVVVVDFGFWVGFSFFNGVFYIFGIVGYGVSFFSVGSSRRI